MTGAGVSSASRWGPLGILGCIAAVVFLVTLPTNAFVATPLRTGPPPASLVPLSSAPAFGHPNTARPAPQGWPHGSASPRSLGGSSAYDWPEFHRDPRLTGDAPTSSLSSTNASRLGVAWATKLYGAALDSPVVAYDPILGQTLAYIGTESGNVVAVNVATGQIVWGTWLGSPIRSTPAAFDGAVFVGTVRNPALFKLNATTGAVDCSAISPLPIDGSPTVVRLPSGNATVFVGTTDTSTRPGPLLAMSTGSCAINWKFTGFPQRAGSWDPIAVALNATGTPLVLFGTSDPDAAIYAVNAVTGAKQWRFQTYDPPPGLYDVGAGVAISPPGARGFAHGVAYVPNKYGIMYALDLTNGSMIWSVNFNRIAGVTEGGRSTAALDGGNAVFGFNGGMFDLNASTGAVLWRFNDTGKTEVLSSPAIAGPLGHAIVAAGDLTGALDVVSLANGTLLYRYQTGGYITASPAVTGGNILVSSADGYLYDFAVGGGNDAVLPTSTISSPLDGSVLANPNGNLVAAGTATDPTGLAGVVVAVQSGGTGGPWWDAWTGGWVQGPMASPATINRTANGSALSWTFSYPAPSAGGAFEVIAYAVASGGQSDIRGASSGFAVNYSTFGPHLRAFSTYVAPGAAVTVNGGGFGKSEKVTIVLAGSTLATSTTTPSGYLPALGVRLPATAAFGRVSLVATGLVSGRSATAVIVVSNSWDQFGYSAEHLGYEPNDPTLDNLITPGNHIWVDLAWHFDAGVAINASPAVSNGMAYVADTHGELFAVAIHNAGLIWNWSDPSGAAVNSSPAVDPGLGLVFVTANDGFVYAVSTSTGRLVWKVSIGGALSAPVYQGDELYVVSSKGTVESLAESTGVSSWVTTLSSPIRAAATLDAFHHKLLVGETNGNLVALNSTTGVTLWTYKAGGAITAASTVSSGVVYFGSADGNVTAVREASGAKLWAYRTGGPVKDTPALTSNGTPGGFSLELLVGSSDGNLYALSASNGSLNYLIPIHSTIIGLATAQGVVLLETTTGTLYGARTYSNVEVWKYHTAGKLAGAPAIVDGTIFVGAEDGYLYAFTSYGQAPD